MSRRTRVLLVSPAFHGYWRAISQALHARGHEVACVRYDGRPGLAASLRRRVVLESVARGHLGMLRWSESASRAITALREWKPDVVVIVKGDELGGAEAWWDALDESGARRVTWFYDEIARMHYDDEALAHIGPIASYSPGDTIELSRRGLPVRYLPIAYDRRTPPAPAPRRDDEISFIGSRYESRERFLLELGASLREMPGAPHIRAYGKDWSPLLADRVRTGLTRKRPIPGAPGVGRAEGYGIMAASLATLNLHHAQDGFTVRTFEACGSGAVQLLDRREDEIAELYEPGRELLCFQSAEEAAEGIRRLRAEPQLAERIREAARKRTLAEHTFDHRVAVLEEMWA